MQRTRVLVKVGGVSSRLDVRDDGCRERAVTHAVPVEALEPGVLHHVFKRQPLGRLLATQLLDETRRVLGDFPRELDRLDAFQDDVVSLHRIARGERWPVRTKRRGRQRQRPARDSRGIRKLTFR